MNTLGMCELWGLTLHQPDLIDDRNPYAHCNAVQDFWQCECASRFIHPVYRCNCPFCHIALRGGSSAAAGDVHDHLTALVAAVDSRAIFSQ